ncbi:MAG: hypothetical protein AB7S74_15935 [Hyphomicrobium sp.]
MRQLRDSGWQRRGITWLWDAAALSAVAKPSEVVSLRQWLRMRGSWPQELPSRDGNALVVAGLDGSLDLLSPTDGESWLGGAIKETILAFQDGNDSAALIFWLPDGRRRIKTSATDGVTWQCAAPNSTDRLDFGRLLWGEAREYPQELWLTGASSPSGLFHLRIT